MTVETTLRKPTPPAEARAAAARVTDDELIVELEDGRTVAVPVAWFPRLAHGTADERRTVEVSPMGLHWPALDEDIETRALLLGYGSGEGSGSFQKWLRVQGELRRVGDYSWLRRDALSAGPCDAVTIVGDVRRAMGGYDDPPSAWHFAADADPFARLRRLGVDEDCARVREATDAATLADALDQLAALGLRQEQAGSGDGKPYLLAYRRDTTGVNP